MSRAIARPRPVPPSSWLRASSSRRNGLNTSSRIDGRNAGPVVVDRHRQPAVVAMAGDGDRRREARRVRHQVGEAALERRRLHRDDRRAVERSTLVLWPLRSASAFSSSRNAAMSVGAGVLAGVAAREGEIGLEHAAHLVDVLLEHLGLGHVAEQRELQLEAGQHGAQVVRHAGQHGGALLDGALDALLHLQEGLRGAAHLARAARPEVRRIAALAEALGRVGEPQDRPDLVAQEQDRDGEQHQRGADHPEQEDFRVRRIGRRCAAPTPASPSCRAGCGSRPAPSGRPCRSRTAGRSGGAARATAPGRAARRTASARAAACPRSGRKSTTRPSRSSAIFLTSACSGSCACVFDNSISAAMSRTTAADRFCVTRFQCRSMKTNATTDCRITIGAMMMSSERA